MILNFVGFIIAAYSVIGNDVIQTLGTFLQSNKHYRWWQQYLFIGGIMAIILMAGWYFNGGDVSYGRLDKIDNSIPLTIWHLVPPALLLFITRFGIPVSTTFLILSIFSTQVVIESMLLKSFVGYLVAFVSAYAIYGLAVYHWEDPATLKLKQNKKRWVILQWVSTSFLWSLWLIQDFANLYVFLPKVLNLWQMLLSLSVLLAILAFIILSKGGAIQKVVENKSNSSNIRSATIIDFIYGLVLFVFTMVNDVPMSTTWAFIGVLAGREIALRQRVFTGTMKKGIRLVYTDFGKVFIGITVSISCILGLKYLNLI